MNWWLMALVPGTQEAEAGELFKGQKFILAHEIEILKNNAKSNTSKLLTVS